MTPELADEIRALFATGLPSQPIYELKLVTAPPVGEPWWNSGVVYRKKLYDRRIVRAPDHKVWDQFEVPQGYSGRAPIGCVAALFFSGPEASGGEAEPREHRSRQGYALAGTCQCSIWRLFALPFYFFKHLVFRGLFRAGLYGFAVAGISAYGRWLRDFKMYEKILADRLRQPRRSG